MSWGVWNEADTLHAYTWVDVGGDRDRNHQSGSAGGVVRIRSAWSHKIGDRGRELGRIENPITVPGHPIYDETFAYVLGEATLFVTYRDTNGELSVVYAELAWAGDGVDEPAARAVVRSLLPDGGKLTELYVAPPTSSGPVALVTERYESASLG